MKLFATLVGGVALFVIAGCSTHYYHYVDPACMAEWHEHVSSTVSRAHGHHKTPRKLASQRDDVVFTHRCGGIRSTSGK